MTSSASQKASAILRAEDLRTTITQIGPKSLREIGRILDSKGIKTVTGRDWSAVAVSDVLRRLGIETALPDRKVRHSALFSSQSVEWSTPDSLWDILDAEYHFTLDAAASNENAKCDFYDIELDGLKQPWPGTVWVNPPFGRTIARWVTKAHSEAQNGSVVVMLLPVRSDTRWWSTVMLASEIRLLDRRIKFGGSSSNSPFPSCIVVFRKGVWAPSLSTMAAL
jgi:phage N-6-adenine-methyltransferase